MIRKTLDHRQITNQPSKGGTGKEPEPKRQLVLTSLSILMTGGRNDTLL